MRSWLLTALVVAGGTCAAVICWVGPWRSVPEPHEHPADDARHGPPWFRDVTAASGIHFTYRNGEEAKQFSIVEALGGGVALIDYDGDGLLDIFVTGGGYFGGPKQQELVGQPCKLFKNLGDGKFRDVTEAAGLDLPWHYTHGAVVADYDRDGWPDLLVTGYGKLVLLHNEPDGKGGRHFVDVTAALGLLDNSWSTSAAWGDLDGDGWPDLYVCHYVDWSFANNPICEGVIPGVPREVCGPLKFKPLRHALYRNDRGRAFQDVTEQLGFQPVGAGLGVVCVDVNDDGRPDLFVANDGNNRFLILNRGDRLEERGLAAGVAVDDNGQPNGSMGTDAGDYDGSGRPSLWVTNYQNELPGLFHNRGGELFDYQSRKVGLPLLGNQFVSFGTGFFDVDNDGWEDLVIVSGHVFLRPTDSSAFLQRPVLLRNVDRQGRRFFKDASSMGGAFFQTPARGRGLAVGDLDNDGWPDLVISHTNTPVVILRNEAGTDQMAGVLSSTANWLGVKLVGKQHRDVVGSTVILETGRRKLTRFAKGGGSYLSANDQRILFGLGNAVQVERITVRWSWGQTQTWENLKPNAYWLLREGEAVAEMCPPQLRADRGRDPQPP